jgi:hypothetical protein
MAATVLGRRHSLGGEVRAANVFAHRCGNQCACVQVVSRNRKLCKIAVAIEWACGTLRSFVPSTAQHMLATATDLRDKLSHKGVNAQDNTMPSFLKNVLDQMVSRAGELKLTEQAAAAAANEAADVAK